MSPQNEITAAIESLQAFLADTAAFALLFGSFAKGKITPESDIDFGVYLKTPLVTWEEKVDFYGQVDGLFQRKTDCIILNSADIIITMQVLANGQMILNNNPTLYLDYRARKISEYIDFKLDRAIIEKNLLKGGLYA